MILRSSPGGSKTASEQYTFKSHAQEGCNGIFSSKSSSPLLPGKTLCSLGKGASACDPTWDVEKSTVFEQPWCHLCFNLYLPWSHREERQSLESVLFPPAALLDPERRVRVNGWLQRQTWEIALSLILSLGTWPFVHFQVVALRSLDFCPDRYRPSFFPSLLPKSAPAPLVTAAAASSAV